MANGLITCCSHYLIIQSGDNQSGFQGHCGLSEDALECFSVTGSSSQMDKLVRAQVVPKGRRGSRMLCSTCSSSSLGKEADVKALQRRGSISRSGIKVEKSINESPILKQINQLKTRIKTRISTRNLPRAISQENELNASRLKRKTEKIYFPRQ